MAADSGPAMGWERMGAYRLGFPHNGEIVSDVEIYNATYGTDAIGLAVAEIAANNYCCITTKASKTYHFVISVPPGETFTIEQFKYVERSALSILGFEECGALSATHSSKPHLHRHVCVATGSRKDRKNKRPRFDFLKLMRLARQVEIEFDLRPAWPNR